MAHPDPAQTPAEYIKQHIRTVPDWPAPGVQFRDITPLLANPRVFRVLIDELPELHGSDKLRAADLPLFTLVSYEGH